MITVPAIVRAAESVDPLPTSAIRLAGLVAAPEPDLDAVVDVIAYDQVLTAAILSAANSAASAPASRITTARDAVLRVGTGTLLTLAVAGGVRNRMRRALPEYDLLEDQLWRHSVASALAAELLVTRAGHPAPAESVAAALLHDVGKLVLAKFVDGDVQARMADARAGGCTPLEAETEVLGCNHPEIGAIVAAAWGLPEAIVDAIRAHHVPDADGHDAEMAVHLANVVAIRVGTAPGSHASPASTARALDRLQLSAASFDELCATVGRRLSEVVERYS